MWRSYEYYSKADGEYRYGIVKGNDRIPLNEANRKKADKAAKKLNKIDKKDDKSVRDLNEPGCNEPGVVC